MKTQFLNMKEAFIHDNMCIQLRYATRTNGSNERWITKRSIKKVEIIHNQQCNAWNERFFYNNEAPYTKYAAIFTNYLLSR